MQGGDTVALKCTAMEEDASRGMSGKTLQIISLGAPIPTAVVVGEDTIMELVDSIPLLLSMLKKSTIRRSKKLKYTDKSSMTRHHGLTSSMLLPRCACVIFVNSLF